MPAKPKHSNYFRHDNKGNFSKFCQNLDEDALIIMPIVMYICIIAVDTTKQKVAV